MNRIFIVGNPRSGTTFLQRLLYEQYEVNTFPETHFCKKLSAKRGLRGIFDMFLSAKSSALFDLCQSLSKELISDSMKEEIGKLRTPKNRLVFFVSFLNDMTLNKNYDAWLEKTPDHLRYIPLITKIISEAKFIHILRNPEDTISSHFYYASMYPKEWEGPYTLKFCIDYWKKSLSLHQSYFNESNHIFVNYDQLVKNPEGVCKEIASDIGIIQREGKLTSQITKYARKEEKWKNRVLDGQEYVKQKYLGEPELNFIRSSTKGLSYNISEW